MIVSRLYLTASRPYLMFRVCLCARYQEPKRISFNNHYSLFRYLQGTIDLGLWYPKDIE